MFYYSPIYFKRNLYLTIPVLLEYIKFPQLQKFKTEKEANDAAQEQLLKDIAWPKEFAETQSIQSSEEACLIKYRSSEKEIHLFKCVTLDQKMVFDSDNPMILEIRMDGKIIEKQVIEPTQPTPSAPTFIRTCTEQGLIKDTFAYVEQLTKKIKTLEKENNNLKERCTSKEASLIELNRQIQSLKEELLITCQEKECMQKKLLHSEALTTRLKLEKEQAQSKTLEESFEILSSSNEPLDLSVISQAEVLYPTLPRHSLDFYRPTPPSP